MESATAGQLGLAIADEETDMDVGVIILVTDCTTVVRWSKLPVATPTPDAMMAPTTPATTATDQVLVDARVKRDEDGCGADQAAAVPISEG
jgi:hypothetical protein